MNKIGINFKNDKQMDYEAILSGIFPETELAIIQEAIRLIIGEKVKNPDHKRCLRETEAARYCGVSKWTLQRWRKASLLPTIHLGERIYVYRLDDLDSFLESRRHSSLKASQSEEAILQR